MKTFSLDHCPICDVKIRNGAFSFQCYEDTHNLYIAKDWMFLDKVSKVQPLQQVGFDQAMEIGYGFMKHPDLEPYNAHCMAWQFKDYVAFQKAIPAFRELNQMFQNYYLIK